MRSIEGGIFEGEVLPKEESERKRMQASLVQLAWAERGVDRAKGGEERPHGERIQEWLDAHGDWFRNTIIDNEDHHDLLAEFEEDPDGTLDALDTLYQDTSLSH